MVGEGSFILGGYDRAKILGGKTGTNVTLPIQWSGRCPTGLVVQMSEVLLNFPNGTSPDLLAGVALGACIQPDWPGVISLPPEQQDEWQYITGVKWDRKSWSKGVNYGGAMFNTSSA